MSNRKPKPKAAAQPKPATPPEQPQADHSNDTHGPQGFTVNIVREECITHAFKFKPGQHVAIRALDRVGVVQGVLTGRSRTEYSVEWVDNGKFENRYFLADELAGVDV